MRNGLIGFIVILITLTILLIPEYIENIISDYFEGSHLVIFAFVVLVIPISIFFEKIFAKFINLIFHNKSFQKDIIKHFENSKNKKSNIFGIKCYNCKQRGLIITKDSMQLGIFAKQCSECKSINIIRQPAYCGIPLVLSILLQKAGVFTSLEQFNLSFMIAIVFTVVLLILHFLTPAKSLNN